MPLIRTFYVLVIGLAVLEPAAARTLRVHTWGTDSPECASRSDPCASIAQAISNAGRRDRIIVGPGRYVGNLEIAGDRDRLRLESLAGARATVIAAHAAGVALTIDADRVQVGKRGRGFTVDENFTGATYGVLVSGARVSLSDLRVTGFSSGAGVRVTGERVLIRDSEASGNERGFVLEATANRPLLQRNVARDSDDHGFDIEGGAGGTFRDNVAVDNGLRGFQIEGTAHRFQRNISARNIDGFRVPDGGSASGLRFEDNVAQGNDSIGFFERERGQVRLFRGNTMTGNGNAGFHLASGDTDGISFSNNNLYANPTCGLQFISGLELRLRSNWWGTTDPPSQAGVAGPADICKPGSASVTVSPRRSENPIKVRGNI